MKCIRSIIGFKVSLALFYASEALAAGGHGHDSAHGHADAHHAESAGGLPQLDPTWFPSQLFWLVATFAFLYILFSKTILPALSSTIETRREQIDGDLHTAREMKEEAERVHEAYEEALEEARNKAQESMLKAEAKIKEKAAKKLDTLREKSAKDTEKAEAAITKAKKAALKEMDAIAAEVASNAAEKIVGISADIKQAKTVVANINKKAA